jgi:hypothetical protein
VGSIAMKLAAAPPQAAAFFQFGENDKFDRIIRASQVSWAGHGAPCGGRMEAFLVFLLRRPPGRDMGVERTGLRRPRYY